jgi:hypothetical protein
MGGRRRRRRLPLRPLYRDCNSHNTIHAIAHIHPNPISDSHSDFATDADENVHRTRNDFPIFDRVGNGNTAPNPLSHASCNSFKDVFCNESWPASQTHELKVTAFRKHHCD